MGARCGAAGDAVSGADVAGRSLDRVDRRILRLLQQDGRTSVSQLAREVHLSVTPTLERVRKLETAIIFAAHCLFFSGKVLHPKLSKMRAGHPGQFRCVSGRPIE